MTTSAGNEYKASPRSMLRFVWDGAHKVNVSRDDKEIDVFTVGSVMHERATDAEVRAGIARWLEGGKW